MAKGLLIEKKGPVGVVMTPDGRFARVFLWGKQQTLGQEVQGQELKFPSFIQGAVAAVVMMVMITGLWMNLLVNPAAAYVALDINPSLELTVNRSGKVIKAEGLDKEGQQLLAKVATKDQELYQAVKLLVAGAAELHYLNETNNVVLTTVTPIKEQGVVDEEKLQSSVEQTVATLPLEVKVVTEQASTEEHKQANQKGLSVGRYLIHQKSVQQGKEITLDELKNKGLGQLEKEKGIQIELILPHAKYQVKAKNSKKFNEPEQEKLQSEQKGQEALQTKGSHFTPPGQLKKTTRPEQTDAAVDIEVINSNKKEDDHKKDRGQVKSSKDQIKTDEDDQEQEKVSDQRRDDRRPSQLSPETDQMKDQQSKKTEQQEKKEKNKNKD